MKGSSKKKITNQGEPFLKTNNKKKKLHTITLLLICNGITPPEVVFTSSCILIRSVQKEEFSSQLGMVTPTFNLGSWEAEAG